MSDGMDFRAAAARIRPYVVGTPLIAAGENLWLKCEHVQRTRSFKLRGALNAVLSADESELSAGVICASAGNHGLGVAHACNLRGAMCTVVVPAAAPKVKRDAIAALGAALWPVQGGYGQAEAAGRQMAAEGGALWISPYNNWRVIEGQGTLGLELADQLRSNGVEKGAVFVPCSGGGLLAGVGLALHQAAPELRVIGVQTAAAPYLKAAFEGESFDPANELETLADGLSGPVEPGSVTLDLLPQAADGVQTVTESELKRAMAELVRMGHQIEPSAAVGWVAAKRHDPGVLRIVILSGGNVDPSLYSEFKRAASD